MAQETNHSESPPTHRGKRRAHGGGSRTSAVAKVGFYSLDRDCPEEQVLRAALEKAGDFAWRRLQIPPDTEGWAKLTSDLVPLGLSAVIVVIGAAEVTAVEALFAQLRLNDPQRPILVAPHGLTSDEISEVLSHGASDFLLPPYRAEDLVPRLRRLLSRAPSEARAVARIRTDVGLRNI